MTEMISQLDSDGFFTGTIEEIADDAGCPPGWAHAAPPSSIPDGAAAQWMGGAQGWLIFPGGKPSDLPRRKAQAFVAIDRLRDLKINGGFPFAGKAFQSDRDSRENIAGAAQLAALAIAAGAQAGDLRWADPLDDFEWIAADNSTVALDAPTTIALGKTAAAIKKNLIFHARALKDQINAAADDAAFDAIDINAGWPA